MKRKFLLIIIALFLLSACAAGDAASELSAVPAGTKDATEPTVISTSEPTTEPIPKPEETVITLATTTPDETDWRANVAASLPYNRPNASPVYFTTDISPEGLMAVYLALEAEPTGKVAVKITTGEPPRSNYLQPALIKDLVQHVNGTLVESNTAYGGKRGSNDFHLQVAEDHGFTAIAPFDLQDADGEISLPIEGGEVLDENLVGVSFPNYDYYIVLSHFKGHQSAGFGGAIKNISIGIASRSGKIWIHSGGQRKSGSLNGNQDKFLKSMAEAGKSVSDALNQNILYINVMNNLSIDCDCNGNPAKPDMHDIGILASFDAVALDQACLDLVYAAPDADKLPTRIESRNGALTVEHAAAIGLGSREYTFISID